jgi:predicted  nucleic acid-binding Zn-ribbon protein
MGRWQFFIIGPTIRVAVSQAWTLARIHSFEQVPVTPTLGLLRVSAVTDMHAAPGDRRPTLLADDGLTVTRFSALAAPDDIGGTLRSAYSTPHEIVSPQTVFSLEFDDGLVIALPAPTLVTPLDSQPTVDAGRSPAPAPDWWGLLLEAAQARAELRATLELSLLGAREAEDPHAEYLVADVDARIAEAVDRADSAVLELAAERDLHENLRDRYARLEAQVQDFAQRIENAERERDEALLARDQAEESTAPLRAAQARAESELDDLRDQVHKMSLERDEVSRQAAAFDEVAVKARERAASAESESRASAARLAELEVWTGELERRLAETTTALGDARMAAERDEADLRRLHGELAETRAELELFQTQGIRPASDLSVRPLPGPPRAHLSPSPSELDEIRRDAVREADRRADRDLADAGY